MEMHPAMTAMHQWIIGAATGDWNGLLALLDPVTGFREYLAWPGGLR